MIRAGHFGLVVGSKAATNTWPTVADWVLWVAGREPRPANIALMKEMAPDDAESGGVPLNTRLMLGVADAAELALGLDALLADRAEAARAGARARLRVAERHGARRLTDRLESLYATAVEEGACAS